ncbi:hypothetical protein HPP92_019890 [Vanilla planifolia]|uniref:Trs120/TRAPPC9 N-terminal domain-containing protein n=1 Tax=Vanilla planifolia TaxID=51239 RepID=A0A835Q3Q1_VANPL|nr:hypothetical protein HPP92_019890 [Vanilla planifolia]
MIRIAVLPVGGPIPHSRLREYLSMLARHTRIDLSSISSFYSEQQKSPFTHQPWESGSLRFKYMVGGGPPSPWEDFQAHRKILAVIGLCHCPASPDLDLVIDQFAIVSKGYTSALAKRLFAFSPSDAQVRLEVFLRRGSTKRIVVAEKVSSIMLSYGGITQTKVVKNNEKVGRGSRKRKQYNFVPPSDQQTQELHMLTMIQDLAATLLMEFEQWVLQAESTGTILKTPLDSQSSLGSEEVDRMYDKDSVLEDEVRYRYYSVIQLYRRSYVQDNAQRVSTVTFELEAQLKLARYLCRRCVTKEVAELLMNASDGAKSLIDASDRLILYIEISRLFSSIGYQRKAAFFSRQVAQLYLQQDNVSAAISAMQVLSMTSKAYHVQRLALRRDLEEKDPT